MNMLKQKLLDLKIVEDNQYLDKYCQLVVANKKTLREKFKTQKHHIIPRSYYTQNNLPLDNSASNIVNFKHSDHILAHFYLCKCSVVDYFTYSNEYAVLYMLRIHALPEEEDAVIQAAINYGEIYSDFCVKQSQRYLGKPGKTKGYKASEETRKKLSESHKGIKRSAESLVKQRETLKRLYAAGIMQRERSETMKSNLAQTNKGSRVMNKDGVQKYVNKKDIDSYLSQGWKFGLNAVNKEKWSHNKVVQKGRTVSEETRRKQSEAKRGKKLGPYMTLVKDNHKVHAFNEDTIRDYYAKGYITTLNKTFISLEETLNVFRDKIR